MSIIVAKFGGTSVANYQAMVRCADIVLSDPKVKLVVVSASSGVTNLLVDLIHDNLSTEKRISLIDDVIKIQYHILADLKLDQERHQFIVITLDNLLSKISLLSEKLASHIDKSTIDELLSIGEQCSSLLFSEVLIKQGANSLVFDARKVIRTDSNHGKAEPSISDIAALADKLLKPLINGHILVTQGFIGSDEQGFTTTLGRGGSDYSAALFAEALAAEALQIWTDVAGIYTTDPRITSKARALKEISFNEAAEMATFGAKVLHPATILPAVRRQIQVFVGSSRAPKEGGTWIRHQVINPPLFRAVAIRRHQTLLTLHSLQMLHAQGFLAETFTTLAKHKISVDLITTSEVNVSLTLDKTGSNSSGSGLISEALLQELAEHSRVVVEDHLALVAIIGNQIATTAGVCKRIFSVLEPFNIRMICQGASSHNLCVVVSNNDVDNVVSSLHHHLFEDADN